MRTYLIAVCLFLLSSVPAFAEVAVIVNRDNPLASIKRMELASIYLGKKRLFADKMPVTAVDLSEGDSARIEFFNTMLKKDEEAYRMYWVRMIFSGKGHPPVSFGSHQEVVKYVKENRGAIGFVDITHVTPDVKVIRVDGMD